MNIEWLKSYTVFVEQLNFTKAAKIRHITQPALHTQIKNLSDQIGVPLYYTNGNKIELTPAGIKLARIARDISQRIGNIKNDVLEDKQSQLITLAAGQGSFLYLLGNSLKKYNQRCTHQLRLLTTNQQETVDLIHSGRADLGVTTLEEIPKNFHAELLATVEYKFIIKDEENRFKNAKSIRLSDVSKYNLILPKKEHPMRRGIEKYLLRNNISLSSSIEANGWELMIHFVKLGLGASIINGCCKIPKTVTALPIRGLPTIKYYLLYHKNQFVSPALQSLIDVIIEETRKLTFD